MKQKITTAVLGIWTISLFGCAHGLMRGSVAMKTSENEAHVCLGDKEVGVGDRVNVFQNVCESKYTDDSVSPSCEKRKVGEGVVKETLNNHYSVVQFDSGVPFK